MSELLKGAPVAGAITEELIVRCEALKSNGITPTLAIVRVGENPGDLSYERGAMKRCEKVGIAVKNITLNESISTEELLEEIEKINLDASIHGCLLFRPLPRHLDEARICEALDPKKDVDCMTGASLTSVFTGRGVGFAPCTAQSCIEILKSYVGNLSGKNVTVIGRSLVIGKPVAMLLMKENATVTICHTRTVDMPKICKTAEILVVAAGRAGIVGPTYTNPDQMIIDVGINEKADGGICGDVDFDSVSELCKGITPVPGGVGAVTTAVLCKHVIEAAEKLNA